MALKRNETYPGRFSNPTDDHPQGAFKNRSAPGAQDGSYLEQQWANDWDGFFGRLLTLAGVTPNGEVDTASSSQYYDALKSLFLQRTDPFADIKADGTVNTALANLGLGVAALGIHNVVSFTTSHVVQWTVPDILKQGRKCYVVVIGGGASGAYGDATSGGTGGSAGGRSEKIVDLTGVDAVTVTVGAGGAPVTTNGTVGNAGGTSSFGTYLSATGAPTTNVFSSQLGGTGTGGDVNINGFLGAPATVGSTDGKRTGGNGGGPGGGVGKHSAAQQGAESERNAQSPGSGGAGLAYYSGLTGSTGRGADGAIYIYW